MSLQPPPVPPHAGPPDAGPPPPDRPDGAVSALDRERDDLAGVVGSPFGRAARLAALIGLVVLLGVTQGVSMLIVVAAIVVMIFLHELGHYVMAKRAGMLVTEFFIGFGPRIWSFHRGETEYGIKAIPAGAYVKIIGMSNMEEVDPALESRTYRQGTFAQRVGVAIAGSTMHFLIALVLLFVQFAFIGDPTTDRWSVGSVVPGSAAAAAGLQEGDEITGIGGTEVSSFDEFRTALADVPPGEVDLTLVRDGSTVVEPVALSQRLKLIGTVGEDVDVVDNGDELLVGQPVEDGRAAAAGLVGGATLLAVGGEPVQDLDGVAAAAASAEDGALTLTVSEDGAAPVDVRVDLGTEVAATEPGSFVGIGSQPVLVDRSLPESAWGAVETFGTVSAASVVGVGKFLWPPNMFGFIADAVSGGPGENRTSEPTSAAEGPSAVDETRPISIVGVAMLGSDLSSQNMSNLVLFLAQLNIFIGIFNLFPLLPFDGGHVVIAFYEKAQELRRRTRQRYLADVSRMLPVAYGVIMVLVVVGVLAIFVDVTRGVDL